MCGKVFHLDAHCHQSLQVPPAPPALLKPPLATSAPSAMLVPVPAGLISAQRDRGSSVVFTSIAEPTLAVVPASSFCHSVSRNLTCPLISAAPSRHTARRVTAPMRHQPAWVVQG